MLTKITHSNGDTFDSIASAADWVIAAGLTAYGRRTTINKIRSAIQSGDSCFGLRWQQVEVQEELPERGINMRQRSPWKPITHRNAAIDTRDEQALHTQLAAKNATVAAQRSQAYDEAEGVQAVLYKTLPHYYTIEDMRRDSFTLPTYPIIYWRDLNPIGCNDIGELAVAASTTIRQTELHELLEHNTLCGTPVELSSAAKLAIQKLCST